MTGTSGIGRTPNLPAAAFASPCSWAPAAAGMDAKPARTWLMSHFKVAASELQHCEGVAEGYEMATSRS